MRTLVLLAAAAIGGMATAQTTGTQMGAQTTDQSGTAAQAGTEMQAGTGAQTTVTTGTGVSMAQAGGEVAAPGNSNPELDARGIPVISAPAVVPPGANQPIAVAPGAQVVPAANQQAVFSTRPGAESYPPCTATVTDNCVQAYVGRGSGSRRRR